MRQFHVPRRTVPVAARAALLASLVLSGCDGSNAIAPGSRRDTPWARMTPAQLQIAIADADGKVFIGFKDPWESAGMTEQGRVLASAEAVEGAKALLASLEIDITFEYDLPHVAAVMRPSQLVFLLRDSRVEYVEPIVSGWRN